MSGESVSVVIPVRNGAAYLAEAVTSVRAQTHPVLEIIIVDDGSTDDTPAVIAALEGDIRSVRQATGGAGAARNHGASLARGDWLAFLDADDLWAPRKLELQLAWMREHPETEVVFGLGGNFAVMPDGARHEEPPRPAFLPGAALMQRAFFLRAARFAEQIAPSEVIEWNLRLRQHGAKLQVLPETVLHRRIHTANIRRTGLQDGRTIDLRLLRDWVRQKRS